MTNATLPRAGRRITDPPSVTALAADALRAMIMDGELLPGDRVVESRISEALGVSRPPLREAMRVLEQEGLLLQLPRRGAIVTPMGIQDVYEIVTLRDQLEEMAVRIGVPVTDAGRLENLRTALENLENNARDDSERTAVQDSYAFHLALVELSGHRRLIEAYRGQSMQLRMCMGLNRRARAHEESLIQRAARHRALFAEVEKGDVDAVLRSLHGSGSRTFLGELDSTLEPGSPEAMAWLTRATS